MIALATRPDPKTASVEELADFWAANAEEIQATDSWILSAKRRLREALRDRLVVDTLSGRLTLSTDAFVYDIEGLVEQFPEVGLHSVTVECQTTEKAEQIISYALESGWDPVDVDHSMRPDKRLINRLIKTGAPEKAAALLGLRTANGRIELAP